VHVCSKMVYAMENMKAEEGIGGLSVSSRVLGAGC
jgi:hypothetical protein